MYTIPRRNVTAIASVTVLIMASMHTTLSLAKSLESNGDGAIVGNACEFYEWSPSLLRPSWAGAPSSNLRLPSAVSASSALPAATASLAMRSAYSSVYSCRLELGYLRPGSAHGSDF